MYENASYSGFDESFAVIIEHLMVLSMEVLGRGWRTRSRISSESARGVYMICGCENSGSVRQLFSCQYLRTNNDINEAACKAVKALS